MGLKNLAKFISEANKEKTVEQDFLYQLNETVVKNQIDNGRTPSQSYKPSSMGGCMRNMYYIKTGAEMDPPSIDPEDSSGIGIMESGTDRHERIQDAVMKMKGYDKDFEWIDAEDYLRDWPQPGTKVVKRQGNEVKLYNEILELSFLCDGIIRHKKTGKFYVLEIKTEASFKFQGRTEPVNKHMFQASAYAACLGIDDIIFIYENRDFCNRKAFHVEVTDLEKFERVFNVIETCNTYIALDKVPPMTTSKSECKYCKYKKICAATGPTESI
jgi:CRISPR/Cas system-associated exonuclease Cas4 (RecB family)